MSAKPNTTWWAVWNSYQQQWVAGTLAVDRSDAMTQLHRDHNTREFMIESGVFHAMRVSLSHLPGALIPPRQEPKVIEEQKIIKFPGRKS